MFEKPVNSKKINPANNGAMQRGDAYARDTTAPLKLPGPSQRSSLGKRACILVLGVHRSGTSSLAHLVNLLGAKLPEKVLGPGHGNPLGHWEPVGLMEINEEILAVVDRSWNDPRSIPRSWFRSREAYAFHERIAAEITSSYGDAPLILIKEPRICRLAPLYLDVLDALRIEPLVILPVRHPGEVIRSIEERDQMDPRIAELLWLRSLLEVEEATRVCVRVWTSLEGLLEDWQRTVQSITDGLGITWPNEPAEVSDEVAEVVKPRHCHHRISDDPTLLALSSLTIRAWEAAQRGLDGDEDRARALFNEVRKPIWDIDRLSIPHEECIEKRFAEVGQQLQARDARVEQLQLDLSRLQSLLNERDSDGVQLRKQIDSLQRSACWRLTWPIRWLHEKARRAKSVFTKVHLD